MQSKRTAALGLVIAFTAISCGGGGGASDDPTIGAAGATCTASGNQVSISSDNLKYDKSCLAVPANQDFTINFDNQEGLPHNVVILKDKDSSDPVFTGDIITGPKKLGYQVKGLAAGTYRFRCSVHPTQMKGTFIVQ